MNRRPAYLLIISAFVLLLFTCCTEGNRGNRIYHLDTDENFNHIQFTQTWTPTACGPGGNIKCMNPMPAYYANNFSMHGLWPAAADGSTLGSSGKKPTLPADLFKEIEGQMNIYWANINSKQPSHDFWWHEWTDHGVRGNWGGDRIQKYFLDGIQSRAKINLLSVLVTNGIQFNTDYKKEELVGAITKVLPVTNVYIACSKQQSGSYYLYEVLICLDKVTLGYISCPVDTDPRGCKGESFRIPHT